MNCQVRPHMNRGYLGVADTPTPNTSIQPLSLPGCTNALYWLFWMDVSSLGILPSKKYPVELFENVSNECQKVTFQNGLG